jgi:glycosyltransferase involved in cell wall biosynthesis
MHAYLKLKSIMKIILIYFFIFINKTIIFQKNNNKKKINMKSRDKDFQMFRDVFPTIKQNKTIQSIEEIFNSKTLFISEANLSQKYIKYIRRINETEEEKYNKKFSGIETKIRPNIFNKRVNQFNFKDYLYFCFKNKLLFDTNKIKYNNKPLISIILPSFNKEDSLMISVRSIQNQHFKNIEIIIVDDCSTDNSSMLFKYLLETDKRIRIFTHLKNMGVWRSRMDGFLYSRGKYILYFDTGDLYEDNYVLDDFYNIMEKYNLDSCKFLFRMIYHYNNTKPNQVIFHIYNKSKIIYGSENINHMNRLIFKKCGVIWTRITRANTMIKGIYLLNDRVLNIYKNLWEDVWFNELINRASYSFLIVERIGYLYYKGTKGYGDVTLKNEIEKDRMVQEYINFLIFDYFIIPKSTSRIISTLKKYNCDKSKIKLIYFRTNFYILNDLLVLLINDPEVSFNDKIFLNKLLYNSKKRQANINNF